MSNIEPLRLLANEVREAYFTATGKTCLVSFEVSESGIPEKGMPYTWHVIAKCSGRAVAHTDVNARYEDLRDAVLSCRQSLRDNLENPAFSIVEGLDM